jgi:cyanocobalamin reductase (cyanide-eliminating) / alkylcobalamin dealkylase
MAAHEVIARVIAERCAAGGIDLCATCASADYDAAVPAEYRLPDVGRARALVVVLGNTRALWPHVRDAVASGAPNPVDDYVTRVVRDAVDAALATVTPRPRAEIRFAPEPPPRRVAMQRLAHVAGLAWLAPSHMCVHPTFGPWMALRAAIVIDVDGPESRAPIAAPCDCATGCQAALDRAIAAGPPRDQAELRDRWRLWLAVRDACPVGRAHRYDDDQIRYHYAGDLPSRS